MLLRELFVSLGLEVDEAAFAKGQLAAELVKAALAKVVEVAKEVVHEFVSQTLEVAEYGDKVVKTSKQIGIATDALQELQYAGRLADLSAEEMSQSIGLLSRHMQAAKTGSEEAGKAFKGIEFQRGGKLLATDEVLGNIADKFEQMPDGAEKTALAMQLFGRAGKQMIPLLNEGSSKLEELKREAHELGLVMSEDDAKAGEEFNDTLKRLRAVAEGIWRGAIAPMLPAMTELAKKFLAWRKANAQIISQRIQSFLGAVLKVVGLLGDAFDFLTRNTTAVLIVMGAVGLYGVIQKLIIGMEALSIASVRAGAAAMWAWIKAAAPFIAIGALIAGFLLIFDDIKTYKEGGKSLYGTFKKEIDSWLEPNKKDPWWLAAIKELVNWLREALGLIDKLQIGTKNTSGSELRQSGGYVTKGAGYLQGQLYGGSSIAARLARGEIRSRRNWMGGTSYDEVSDPAERARLAAEYAQQHPDTVARLQREAGLEAPAAPATNMSGGAVIRAPVSISVYQQPGQSGQELATMVKDKIDEHWSSQMEDAQAQSVP